MEASLGDRLSRKEKGPYFPALADTHCKKEAPMELMIPLPLILPDTPLSLDQLEEAVHLWGLAIQQHARARAWQAQAALRPPVACPACHGDWQQRAGSRLRMVETRCGAVR
jgi:hypothetical protein